MKMNRILVIVSCFALFSCKTWEKVVYMQDIKDGTIYQEIVVQPEDRLSIVVTDPKLKKKSTDTVEVGKKGDIVYLTFGEFKVEGMTLIEVSEMIKKVKEGKEGLKDITVTTEFENFKIAVWGEVNHKGTYSFSDNGVTIPDAIKRAGDQTIYGREDNVLIMRKVKVKGKGKGKEEEKIEYHYVDLNSPALKLSPVYQLKHNDVVFVSRINKGIIIQPKDILSITVSSRDPNLAISFNKPMVSYQAGSTSASSSYSQRILGYLVDIDGKIDFPILGPLKVKGLTREELSDMIKQQLITKDLLKDPIVTTEIMNFKITVLGEVRSPGVFELRDDKITLLEALGRAGDLTIYGRRDNVLVTREENGEIIYFHVDLRSSNLTQSPAFYLRQNDVIYVSPNKTQTARTEINENKSMSILLSLASFLMSLIVIISNISK